MKLLLEIKMMFSMMINRDKMRFTERRTRLVATAWNILLIKRGFTMMTDRGPGWMLTTWNT